MPPPSGCPDHHQPIRRTVSLYKPPLPTLHTRLPSQQPPRIEIKLPTLLSGALLAAFAHQVAAGLNNALLAQYYLSDRKVRINLDRVLDRLLDAFTRDLWDELWSFYHPSSSSSAPPSRQVTLLFDGPVQQVILVLNGPETACCILEYLAPGLSRRKHTWSASPEGIDLLLALQLTCSYWHREYPTLSPGGSPHDIARTLHSRMIGGAAASNLIASIRTTLLTPHMLQMHIIESAMWDIVTRKPFPPPPDGFHVVQFRFECRSIGAQEPSQAAPFRLSTLPAITGNASDSYVTTVSEYVSAQWPRHGPRVLRCLEEAVAAAVDTSRQGLPPAGMAMCDDESGYCPGLRLVHVEVEDAMIQLTVSAWTHVLIAVFQQMAWICAALSASPFPDVLSECNVEVSDWRYLSDSIFVDCSLAHRPVSGTEHDPRLRQAATIATGFPINRHHRGKS
ncbi:hypothetical protein B0I35DRAFT_70308 [Stachybotrys elegans]|uniref:Uncharacterized protein n=1 Tax=Stachybotrys elegans TaxID=80388 RepID=A0A8K0SMG9_9HYPO|nr:hypothetical protein B0I35DRAFT_70308 [Stachybotrys elegans]